MSLPVIMVSARLSRRVIGRIYRAADELMAKRSTMPKSKLGKALSYIFNQRDPLEIFLDDARIETHDNDAERDLRHVIVGRNNWMVFASPRLEARPRWCSSLVEASRLIRLERAVNG